MFNIWFPMSVIDDVRWSLWYDFDESPKMMMVNRWSWWFQTSSFGHFDGVGKACKICHGPFRGIISPSLLTDKNISHLNPARSIEKNWSLIQICHEKGGDFGYGAHFSCGWPNQALEEALRQTDKEISELELKEQSPGRKSLGKCGSTDWH